MHVHRIKKNEAISSVKNLLLKKKVIDMNFIKVIASDQPIENHHINSYVKTPERGEGLFPWRLGNSQFFANNLKVR